MKPHIYRRHPLNRHLERAINAGVSKQNSHPFKVMQKYNQVDFVWSCVSLICNLRLSKLLVV